MSSDDNAGHEPYELPEDIMAFVAALRQGDPNAWAILESEVKRLVRKHCKRTPPGVDADDIAQETLFRLARSALATFRGAPADQSEQSAQNPLAARHIFIGFLKGIIRHIALDEWGKYFTRMPRAEDEDEEDDRDVTEPELRRVSLSALNLDDLEYLLADPDASLLDQVIAREDQESAGERLARLWAFLRGLRQRNRWNSMKVEWLVLSVCLGITYENIAIAYDVRKEQVRDGIKNVRKQLRKLREQLEGGDPPPGVEPRAPLRPSPADSLDDLPPARTSDDDLQTPIPADVEPRWQPEVTLGDATPARDVVDQDTPHELEIVEAPAWRDDTDDQKLER